MPPPPKDAGYLDKINYVIDAWSNPCCAPWYIYVETLWPALLEAFITLLAFGFDDVIRGYWRPRNLGRRRHSRRRPKPKPKPFYFPEIGEEIGKRLPGADGVKGRKWGNGGQTLWKIDGALQRGLFWWLVADVTIDGLFNWTSLLYETEYCKNIGQCGFSYKRDSCGLTANGFWHHITYPIEDYEEGPPFFHVTGGSTGSLPAFIAFSIDIQETITGGPIQGLRVRLQDTTTNETINEARIGAPDDDGNYEAVAAGQIPAHHGFAAQTWIDNPNCFRCEGVITGLSVIE